MRNVRGMKIGDGVVLALLLGGAAVALASGAWQMSAGDMAVIEVNGVPVRTVALSTSSLSTISGMKGRVVVEVRHERVAVISAECPNHVCVRTGWRSRVGDVIVCVPNGVIVRILGKEQEGVRAVTG